VIADIISREENGGAMMALIGAFLLCSAALVLPALMRLHDLRRARPRPAPPVLPVRRPSPPHSRSLATAAGLVAVGAKTSEAQQFCAGHRIDSIRVGRLDSGGGRTISSNLANAL
jgi:hypothetical protein